MRARLLPCPPLLPVTALACLAAATAGAQTWLGPTSGTGLWNAPANWVGGVVPTNDAHANVIFSASSTSRPVVLNTNWNVASLTVNASPGLITAGSSTPPTIYGTTTTLTLQQGLSTLSTAGLVIQPSLIVPQPQTWNVGGGGLTVGPVSGAGRITKGGAGRLTIPYKQSFTGGMDITGGTVLVADDSGLGPTNAPAGLNGGTLAFGTGPLTSINLSTTRPLTLGANGGTITTRYGTHSLTGPISGPGGLTLATDATWGSVTPSSYNLGRSANTYAGGTTIGGGVTVRANNVTQALGTGNVTLQSGGALVLSTTDNLALGRTVTLQGPTATQYASALVLENPALDPAALVDPASTGGVVALGGGLTSFRSLDMAALGNGQLFLGAGGPAIYAALALGPGAGGAYRLGGGAAGGLLRINGADNVLTGANSLVVGQGGTYQSSLLPTGSTYGSVILDRANDFTGGTTLADGTLVVGHDQALGTGLLTLDAGALYADGYRTLGNPVLITAPGTYSLRFTGSPQFVFTGPVDLGGGVRTLNANGVEMVFAGAIGNGGLTLISGQFLFTGANTFAGGVNVNGGSLLIRDEASLGSGPLKLGGGSLGPQRQTLTVDRAVQVPYSQSAIDTRNGAVTLNGPVTGNTITKRGAGTLTITNPANGAAWSVIEGTLLVNNRTVNKPAANKPDPEPTPTPTPAPNAVPITVTSKGTLGGTGVVGYTAASNGGHLSPGDSGGPGTLTVGSGLLMSEGAQLDFDLGPQAADRLVLGGHYLQVQTSRPLAVNVRDAGGLVPGQTYDLLTWSGLDTYSLAANQFQLGSSPLGGTFSVVGTSAEGALRFTAAAYTPFQAWQSARFGSINAAGSGPLDNPTGDGVANLLKYALGLDPTRPAAAAGLPAVGTLPGYLTLTYSRPKAVTDLVYTPQASADLGPWDGAGVTQEIVADDGMTETIRARVATDGAERRFLRLTVSLQPTPPRDARASTPPAASSAPASLGRR